MTFRACVAAFCLTSVNPWFHFQFFPFPFFADFIQMWDKSFFFRFQSLLIWSPWRTNFFFSFPFIADLTDVRDKSIFFRLHSFLIWLPFARKVVFSVSNHCWFDCHLQEKFFFPFLFAADFYSCWTCVLYLIWLSNLFKYTKNFISRKFSFLIFFTFIK